MFAMYFRVTFVQSYMNYWVGINSPVIYDGVSRDLTMMQAFSLQSATDQSCLPTRTERPTRERTITAEVTTIRPTTTTTFPPTQPTAIFKDNYFTTTVEPTTTRRTTTTTTGRPTTTTKTTTTTKLASTTTMLSQPTTYFYDYYWDTTPSREVPTIPTTTTTTTRKPTTTTTQSTTTTTTEEQTTTALFIPTTSTTLAPTTTTTTHSTTTTSEIDPTTTEVFPTSVTYLHGVTSENNKFTDRQTTVRKFIATTQKDLFSANEALLKEIVTTGNVTMEDPSVKTESVSRAFTPTTKVYELKEETTRAMVPTAKQPTYPTTKDSYFQPTRYPSYPTMGTDVPYSPHDGNYAKLNISSPKSYISDPTYSPTSRRPATNSPDQSDHRYPRYPPTDRSLYPYVPTQYPDSYPTYPPTSGSRLYPRESQNNNNQTQEYITYPPPDGQYTNQRSVTEDLRPFKGQGQNVDQYPQTSNPRPYSNQNLGRQNELFPTYPTLNPESYAGQGQGNVVEHYPTYSPTSETRSAQSHKQETKQNPYADYPPTSGPSVHSNKEQGQIVDSYPTFPPTANTRPYPVQEQTVNSVKNITLPSTDNPKPYPTPVREVMAEIYSQQPIATVNDAYLTFPQTVTPGQVRETTMVSSSDMSTTKLTPTEVQKVRTTLPRTTRAPEVRLYPDMDCGVTLGCFDDCKNGICTFIVSWKPDKETTKFEIRTKSLYTGPYWAAVGFSDDKMMVRLDFRSLFCYFCFQ